MPFKQNKISGLTFVRLTAEDLKNKLEIKQFGLRDSFIVARDQVLEHYNHDDNEENHRLGPPLKESTVPLNTTIPFARNRTGTAPSSYAQLTKSKSSEEHDPSHLHSVTYSPESNTRLLSLHSHHNTNNTMHHLVTSSDLLFANKDYLYIDLCRLVVGRFCSIESIAIDAQQQNIVNTLCFDYYFENSRHIEQFAYDVWKTLSLIHIKTIETLRGFTGHDLMTHIQTHLAQYQLLESDTEALCVSLIGYEYLRLAAIIDDDVRLRTKFVDHDKNDRSTNYFVCSRNHLYQFENARHRQFIKHDEPDRESWYLGCDVSIYSETLKGWNVATVIDIEHDMITVQYAGNIRKTVDRYQDHNVIRSTAQYISHRQNWSKDSELQIYSNRHKKWFLGEVRQVMVKDGEETNDILKVHYTDSKGKVLSKYVERWSSDIRQVSPLMNDCLSLFQRGSNVLVWSKSKERWLPGVITGVVQQHRIVNVRYGDSEKLLPWDSNDLQLCDPNAKALLETYKENHFH
eukprot:234442_1